MRGSWVIKLQKYDDIDDRNVDSKQSGDGLADTVAEGMADEAAEGMADTVCTETQSNM